MPIPRSQLRLTPDELDEVFAREKTAHVATVSPDGEPHVVPLWFAWLGGAMYFTSLRRSRRASDVEHGSRVSVCVDGGDSYADLHGVVLYGRLEEVTDEGERKKAAKAFGDKHWKGMEVPERRSHTWLVLRPDRTVSWDFKKIPAGRDRQRQTSEGS